MSVHYHLHASLFRLSTFFENRPNERVEFLVRVRFEIHGTLAQFPTFDVLDALWIKLEAAIAARAAAPIDFIKQ